MTFTSDALDVRSFLTQLIGAASSTRFWDGLEKNYPGTYGVFLEKKAVELVEDALREFNLKFHSDPVVYYESTLFRVAEALDKAGVISEGQKNDIINEILNSGIVFRSRPKVESDTPAAEPSVNANDERCVLCKRPMGAHTVITEDKECGPFRIVEKIGWRCPVQRKFELVELGLKTELPPGKDFR